VELAVAVVDEALVSVLDADDRSIPSAWLVVASRAVSRNASRRLPSMRMWNATTP
jgi:hypothetical protein